MVENMFDSVVLLWSVQPPNPRTAAGVVAGRCAGTRARRGGAFVGGTTGVGGVGQFLVEIESRGPMELFGHGSTAGWLAETARISPKEARDTVARAVAVNKSRNLDGTPAPAFAPIAGAAAAEGDLGHQQLDPLLAVLRKIPAEVSAEDRSDAERILVDLARRAGRGRSSTPARNCSPAWTPTGTSPRTKTSNRRPGKCFSANGRTGGGG